MEANLDWQQLQWRLKKVASVKADARTPSYVFHSLCRDGDYIGATVGFWFQDPDTGLPLEKNAYTICVHLSAPVLLKAHSPECQLHRRIKRPRSGCTTQIIDKRDCLKVL